MIANYRKIFRSISPNTDDISFYKNLASFLSSEKKYDGAAAVLRKLVKRDPRNPKIYITLTSNLYLQRKDKLDEGIKSLKISIDLLNEGIESLKTSIDIDPLNPTAHLFLGYLLNDKRDFKGAIKEMTEAVELDPKNIEIHLSIAETQDRLGYPKRAIDQYRQYIKRSTDRIKKANAYRAVAIIRYKQESPKDAIAALEESILLNPKDINSRTSIGAILWQQGEKDLAIGQYEEAIKIDPSSIDVHIGLSSMFMIQGKVDDANKILQQAIDLKPSADSLHNIRGNFLSFKKDYIGATKAYQRALELNPNNGHTNANLCFALGKQPGREQEAEKYCRKGIDLPDTDGYPTSSQAFARIKLAENLSDQGKYRESAEQYQKAGSNHGSDRCFASENYKYEESNRRKALIPDDKQWLPPNKNDPDLKIKRSIVKITAEFPTPTYPATGVVISRSKNRTLILTARHVVYDKDNKKSEKIYVEFFSKPPSSQPLMRRYVKVIKSTSLPENIDLALLEISDPLPDNIQAVNMSKPAKVLNNSIRVIGHDGTQGDDKSWSIVSSGKILRNSEKELVISRSQLPLGFSGAPVLNSRNQLLGIIFAGQANLHQDFAYPISIITKQLSDWDITLDR